MNPKESTDEKPCDEIPGDGGREGAGSLPVQRSRSILEALLFVSGEPLTVDKIQTVLDGYTRKELQEILNNLIEEYRGRDGALEIVEIASGYQVRTRPEFSKWIRKLKQEKPGRLSRSSMEALAIIAYRQPITRAEIEHIRGVDSIGVLGSLLEKQLIRILGRKDVPGRPLLYGTTQEFLEVFGLKNLKSMPTLREIEEMLAEQTAERGRLRKEESGPGTGERKQHAEPGYTDDGHHEPDGLECRMPDCTGTASEEEKDLAEGEITAEEMDQILKEARAKYRSVKKAVGGEESAEEDLDSKRARGMDKKEELE